MRTDTSPLCLPSNHLTACYSAHEAVTIPK